jgi:hypothetical protein
MTGSIKQHEASLAERPHNRPVLGPDPDLTSTGPGEARRPEPLQLSAELPVPPHRLHQAPGPGLLASPRATATASGTGTSGTTSTMIASQVCFPGQ